MVCQGGNGRDVGVDGSGGRRVGGSEGGGYLFVNRRYPPFKKGVGLGDVHIGGIFFCYSKLLL